MLLWDEEHLFDHYEVYCYGTDTLLSQRVVLIDEGYARTHRSWISDKLREKVLHLIGSYNLTNNFRGEGDKEGEGTFAPTD